MIDQAALKDRVLARGGNPECLHCRLSELINALLDTPTDGGANVSDVAGALVDIAGDALNQFADQEARVAAFVEAIQRMGGRCGIAAGAILTGGVPPLPKQLH